jgi:hypothetical protein
MCAASVGPAAGVGFDRVHSFPKGQRRGESWGARIGSYDCQAGMRSALRTMVGRRQQRSRHTMLTDKVDGADLNQTFSTSRGPGQVSVRRALHTNCVCATRLYLGSMFVRGQ